jgi:fucose permease
LLFLPGSIAIVFSAAAAGLTLGPIFPLCMAKVLALMHDSPNSKWIFAISGFGATLLPAVTGEVSTREGSLHFGLLVPAFALLVMSSMMILDRTGGPKVLRRKASAS